MCSTESTSPDRAVALGAAVPGVAVGALAGGLVDGAGEVWEAGFWAHACKETRPRQSVKTAAMSVLMEDNLTRSHAVRKQEQRFPCDARASVLPDVGAHRRFAVRMLPLPPLHVVQVAAEPNGCTLHCGNGNPIFDGCPALAAHAALDELRRNQSVPGNAPVSVFIDAGSIDWANGNSGAGVPVLAVGPVVSQHSNAADLAKRSLTFIRLGISPNAAIAAIEPAGSAIVRAAVWHWSHSFCKCASDAPALYQKSDCGGNSLHVTCCQEDKLVLSRRDSTAFARVAGERPTAIY